VLAFASGNALTVANPDVLSHPKHKRS